MMINILLIDDNDNKVQKIQTAIYTVLPLDKVHIVKVQTISEASQVLCKGNFELMILDLNLPMRRDSIPEPDAGLKFLLQLNRRKDLKKPIHIIGLTAFDELLKKHENDF